jgi:hypothetical protein
MNHLEWHPHAFIDETNTVINISVFDSESHDTELIEQVRESNGWKQAICCCTFGQTSIGSTWNGNEFIPKQPYPSWIWNDSIKEWQAPVSMPKDELYLWDESSTSWIPVASSEVIP